jgi:hypothetical protein
MGNGACTRAQALALTPSLPLTDDDDTLGRVHDRRGDGAHLGCELESCVCVCVCVRQRLDLRHLRVPTRFAASHQIAWLPDSNRIVGNIESNLVLREKGAGGREGGREVCGAGARSSRAAVCVCARVVGGAQTDHSPNSL